MEIVFLIFSCIVGGFLFWDAFVKEGDSNPMLAILLLCALSLIGSLIYGEPDDDRPSYYEQQAGN